MLHPYVGRPRELNFSIWIKKKRLKFIRFKKIMKNTKNARVRILLTSIRGLKNLSMINAFEGLCFLQLIRGFCFFYQLCPDVTDEVWRKVHGGIRLEPSFN